MNLRRILTLGVCILVLTGFCVAPATAEPVVAPIVGVVVVELTVETAIFLAGLLGLVALEADLKNRQGDLDANIQKVAEAWDGFVTGLSGWINVESTDGEKYLKCMEYEYSQADGPDKKKGKWYLKARLHDKKVQIQKERISEDEAVRRMIGKEDVFTLNKERALSAGERVTEKTGKALTEMENHGKGKSGYFDHYHLEEKPHTFHLWKWK